MFPYSRQYACWLDARTGGVPVANNPACASVIAQAGTDWFWNWFGNLHPSNNGGTVGAIPDGRICDGGDAGPYNFQPFNQARNDWPYTSVTAGATYQFRFNDWAHHPGRFDVYLTTPGWNPNTPLQWSELELIDTAVDPPRAGPDSDGNGYYFWNTTLPSNRSGQHIAFVHWVRSDSPEDFFSCADMRFDGGNGQLVIPGGGGPPPPPPPVVPPPPPPPVVPPPPPPPVVPPPPPPPGPPGDCAVSYSVNDWGQGFQGDVTITNTSTSAVNGWSLTWTFPSGQGITQLWNGTPESQPGPNISVSNASWNGTIPAGGSVNFGFLGSPGGGGSPSAFSLNGTTCSVS